jgi:AAA domain
VLIGKIYRGCPDADRQILLMHFAGRAPFPKSGHQSGPTILSQRDIPVRNTVLAENGSTVFYESSVNQILAGRGVGKTNFALGLADAMAGGTGILNFKADRPRRILYVDGELPLKQLQERVESMIRPAQRASRLRGQAMETCLRWGFRTQGQQAEGRLSISLG